MSDNRITAYADAALAVARAEGDVAEVEDEMFRLARIFESEDQLHSTLTDPRIPASRRQQIVEDLLDGRASSTTVSIVSMIVGNGRAADLPKIADELVQRASAATGTTVAEVRSAVPLTDEQIARLTEALKARTQRDVTVRNVVDPNVLGGVVTRIGDDVLDGSVRSRLNQLRDVF